MCPGLRFLSGCTGQHSMVLAALLPGLQPQAQTRLRLFSVSPKPKPKFSPCNSSLLPPAPHLLRSPWTRISPVSRHHHHQLTVLLAQANVIPGQIWRCRGKRLNGRRSSHLLPGRKPLHKQQERQQGQGSRSPAPPAPASAENKVKVKDAFQTPLDGGGRRGAISLLTQ